MAQKLAALEVGAFEHAHGVVEYAPGARYDFGPVPSIEDLRDHSARATMLDAVVDFRPLPWLETLQRISALPSLDPIGWAILAIAYGNEIKQPLDPELYEAIGRAFLNRLSSACIVRIELSQTRILPAPVLVPNRGGHDIFHGSDAEAPTLKPASPSSWRRGRRSSREAKLVDEWRTAVNRFVRLHGDAPVDSVTASMVRAYQRIYAGLPARAGAKIGGLPLPKQVELAQAQELKTCLTPGFDGALFTSEWKDALWARHSMEAPRRLRSSPDQVRAG